MTKFPKSKFLHQISKINRAGFTLLELIIVIAVIGVLAAATFGLSATQTVKARDAQRLENIKEIKNALDVYYHDHDYYPDYSAGSPFKLAFDSGQQWRENGTIYMKKVPLDPVTNTHFEYMADTSSQPQWSVVFAKLTNTPSASKCNLPDYTTSNPSCIPSSLGTSYGCVISGSVACGEPPPAPTSPVTQPGVTLAPTPTSMPASNTNLVKDADHDGYYTGSPGPQLLADPTPQNFNGRSYYKTTTSGSSYSYMSSTTPGITPNDCDDTTPSLYRRMSAFRDADNDGYMGTPDTVCMGATYPSGYAAASNDCDDTNATVFQNLSNLVSDTDYDGYYVGSPSTQCVGAAANNWVASNLIGFYSMDENGGSTDTSWYYGHTTMTNNMTESGTTMQPGTPGTGPNNWGDATTYFNGTNSYGTIPDGLSLRTAPYSISLWLKAPQQNEVWKGIIGKPGRDYNMWLGDANIATGGYIHHRFHSTSSGNDGCPNSGSLISWNVWHHIVITNDGSTCRTFIDGNVLTGSVTGSLVIDQGITYVGKNLDGNPGNYLAGNLDEIQIFDRALSVKDVYYLRNYNLVYKEYYKTATGSTNDLIVQSDAINSGDCGPTNNAVWTTRTFYPDADNDSYGSGTGVSICAGSTPPVGYSTNNTDCSPNNAATWQYLFSYQDADGDGYGNPNTGQNVCSGATYLAGWVGNNTDCLDSSGYVYQNINPLASYDYDQDLYYTGAGWGNTCVGSSILVNTPSGPATYYKSIRGYFDVTTGAYGVDCDDNNRNTYQNLPYYADSDGDGYRGTLQYVCTGATLPAGYQATSNDCNESSANVFQTLPVIQDSDNDGYYYYNQAVTNQCVGPLSRPYVGSNMIGWWQLDDGVSGGLTSDVSWYYGHTGIASHGTINGTTQLTNGGRWGDPAKSFGYGDMIGMGTPAQLNRPTGPLSVFTNIKSNNSAAFQVIFGQADYGQGGQFNLNLSRYGDGRIEVNAAGVLLANNLSNTVLASNTWYNVGFVRSGSSGNWTYKIYINGQLDKTFTTNVDPGVQRVTLLGGLASYPQYSFNGVLDEIQIYSRALTDREVSWMNSNDLVLKDYYKDFYGNFTWLYGPDAIGPDANDADNSIY